MICPLLFFVERRFTIKDVKDKISIKQTGVLDNSSELLYEGKQLEDWRTLASYDIKEEDVLEIIYASFSIFVKAQDWKIISLDVLLIDTIKDVKEKIFQEQTGVLVNDWDLIYAGEQLEDWRTLASYDIKEKAILEVSSASFRIFVKPWSGETVDFFCTTM
jgi:hypothetical protein